MRVIIECISISRMTFFLQSSKSHRTKTPKMVRLQSSSLSPELLLPNPNGARSLTDWIATLDGICRIPCSWFPHYSSLPIFIHLKSTSHPCQSSSPRPPVLQLPPCTTPPLCARSVISCFEVAPATAQRLLAFSSTFKQLLFGDFLELEANCKSSRL